MKKSIIDKDTIKQADAYCFLSCMHKPPISRHYADSILLLNLWSKDGIYPAKGFLAKAIALEKTGKYKAAFYQLLKVFKFSNTNAIQQLEVEYHIGVIRTGVGKYKKALDHFNTYLYKIEEKHKEDKSYAYNYSKALYALGTVYNQNKQYDSAALMHKRELEFALKNKNSLNPAYFNLSMGVTTYFQENYSASLDHLLKAEKALTINNDLRNLAHCYFYIGKVYRDEGKKDSTILYFKKSDSIIQEAPTVFPLIIFRHKGSESKEPSTVFGST